MAIAAYRLFLMLASAEFGADFTDEGFYLVWIQQAFFFPQSATQFGFIYHPLFEWLGGDVVRLRQANIVVTWLLAWAVTVTFFRAVLVDRWPTGTWRSAPMLGLAAVFAITFPNLLGQWLPTPSYNSLALQGVLVVAVGLLLAERQVGVVSVAGWILLGIGGWLAFMAKPSTGAAVAAVSLVYLLAAGKGRFWGLACASVVSLLLLLASALWIDGSVAVFVQRLRAGAELLRVLGIEQPFWRLFRIDFVRLHGGETLALLFVLLLVLLSSMRLCASKPIHQQVGGYSLLALLAVNMLVVVGIVAPEWGAKRFYGLSAWAVPIAAVICALMLQRNQWSGTFARPQLAIASCFLVFPHAYAFGTGNNYWTTGATAGIFWVLAGTTVLVTALDGAVLWRALVPVALGAQLVGLLSSQAATEYPYRQPQALEFDTRPVQFGEPATQLMLKPAYMAYVARLRQMAKDAGFRPGMPVIDLTGHSPGSLFSIGARVVGQPWILGGYPGSEQFAMVTLGVPPCEELGRAWILLEPQGPRPVPAPRVLASVGMQLERDYAEVGSLYTPMGFGDYPTANRQLLFKPTRDANQATQACLDARGSAR